MYKCITNFLEILDPVYTRENRTVLFGTEPFHTSSVNAKRFEVVPEVITTEEEYALNHRNPVFFGI